MQCLRNLDAFTKILADRGYVAYFTTQAAYPGKLKESISEYMESCSKGLDTLKPVLLLSGYLQWSGDDLPRVQCYMWVKHQDGAFDLSEMGIVRKNRFGQVLKEIKLKNLSTDTVPSAKEALAMVREPPKQKIGRHRRW